MAHAPNHPWLDKVRETAVFQNPRTVRLFSLALILLPILLLLLHAIARLRAFNLNLNDLL
ncbi:MAG: hypothetical protein IPJ90_22625 [Anaerolineaceae bacterium]|nr:hypothetical protein [Anaerolineaceae bacterium]